MNEKEFFERVEKLLGIEISPMVTAQVKGLRKNYSYQEIFNSIWYFYIHKNVRIDTIEKYGIGIIRDVKNMEEAQNYFKGLAYARERARSSAREANKTQVNKVITKRQKQKVRREEYDWDE